MKNRCLLLALLLTVAVPSNTRSQAASSGGISCGGLSWQQSICKLAPADFSFNDGCNTVTCDGRGEFSTTLMACPEASSESERQRCQTIRENVQLRLDESTGVTCPALSVRAVCATASRGFTYTDGCNTIVCDGSGSGTTTLMFCPDATQPTETALCERRTERLINRLEPRKCAGINATDVCLAEGKEFRFSDGCNTVECGSGGTWTTTLMACPAAGPESVICQWSTSKARRNLKGDQDLNCPELTMSQVCTAETVGFRYSDGCNDVHCASPGKGVSTTRLCRVANAEEASRICRSAKDRMEEKRSQSKRRTTCLTAADVCKQSGERKSFFDGCNYCFCMGLNRAGCTRRACRAYFSTEDEFRTECVRRKAGVIN